MHVIDRRRELTDNLSKLDYPWASSLFQTSSGCRPHDSLDSFFSLGEFVELLLRCTEEATASHYVETRCLVRR